MNTIDLNKKTNRRGNVKTSFQRLMILMVVVMVSTALAGCDILNEGEDLDDDNNGGTTTGKIDKKLVGKWEYLDYTWYFLNDGKFSFMSSELSSMYKGKYNTSNGRVYISDIVRVNSESIKYYDQNLGYSFGSDEQGEYLFIPIYEALQVIFGESESSYTPKKWRKDKTYIP